MTDSIYSPTGRQKISSVSLQHTDTWANPLIVQKDYAPNRSYSAQIATTGGLSTVVSGVTGRSIIVDSYTVGSTGISNFRFLSGTGTYLTGTMGLPANGNVNVSNEAVLTTVSGQALVISTSSVVGGNVTYRIV